MLHWFTVRRQSTRDENQMIWLSQEARDQGSGPRRRYNLARYIKRFSRLLGWKVFSVHFFCCILLKKELTDFFFHLYLRGNEKRKEKKIRGKLCREMVVGGRKNVPWLFVATLQWVCRKKALERPIALSSLLTSLFLKYR